MESRLSRTTVGVMGSGSVDHEEYASAVGELLAECGVNLLTGGGRGVMTAVSRAFTRHPRRRGICIGVIPCASETDRSVPKEGYPNEFVELAIFTHLPHSGLQGKDDLSRNHINILSSAAIVALPGEQGTAAEVSLALRYRKPVIAYSPVAALVEQFPASVPRAATIEGVKEFLKSCGCWLAVMCLILAPASVRGQTVPAAVDCPSGRPGAAEKEICTSPELRKLNDAIDPLTRSLEASLTGAERDALVDTGLPFIIQRNSCQNDRSAIVACVERVLNARSEALRAAAKSPASMLNEIDRYEFLSVAYFRKYGERLVGRQVSVFGCMILEPGPSPSGRTRGAVRDSCASPATQEVPVIFQSMTATAAVNFYDAKQPVSYWKGTVERRDGRIVLSQVEP